MATKKPSKKQQDQDLLDAASNAAIFIPHAAPFVAGAKVARYLYKSDLIQENMAAREAERRRRGGR